MNSNPNPDIWLFGGAFLVLGGVLGCIFPPLMRIGWWPAKWDENDRAWSLVFLSLAFFGIGAWELFKHQ